MKNIYEVIAVKDRYVRGVKGSFKAEEGYVVYRAYQVAESADEAIESVKSYHMPAGTTYDSIRAEFVREA